jgi:hypothetical protein
MKSIDLHGIKHEDVKRKLDVFFWEEIKRKSNNVEIITGFSDRMKEIVFETSLEYGFKVEECLGNGGCLIITLN